MKPNEQEEKRLEKIYADRKLRRIDKWPEELEKVTSTLPPLLRKNLYTLKEKDVLKNQTLTNGAYVYGPVGTGKTVFVLFLLLKYLREQWIENNESFKCSFTNTNELLLLFRKAQAKKLEIDEFDLLDQCCNVNILILDDFGVEKTSDWSFQMLYQIINYRCLHEKKTIFTSNFSLEQLAEKLGDDRITSRIQQMGEIIKMEGLDFRSSL